MNFKKSGLLASSALALGLFVSNFAFAQVDEIIVTATKRTSTLQDAPVAVSVTSADTIEKAQILDIQDLQSVVPSLRVGQLQSSKNTNFRIRGFGNGANNAGIEPSVGVFIDGVYRSRSAAQIGDLPKLERIEVLSGPQSTLFGKNASAGVISITTAKPSFEPTAYVTAGAGNYAQRLLKGYFSTGVSDKAAFSIGGSLNTRNGYAKSALPGLSDNNDRNRWNLRGQILLEPRDDISIRLIGDISKINEVCCHVTNFFNGPTAPAIQALGGQLANPADQFAYINYQNRDSNNLIHDKGISAHIDVDFGNFALTSITAYRKNDANNDYDADYTTAPILVVNDFVDTKTFTQELRLASTGDNRVDWLVGGYFFSENIIQNSGLDIGPAFRPYLDILSGGALGNIEPLYGFAPGTFFNANNDTKEFFTQHDQAYSAFGSVDIHITDQLTLTGGLNYTNDKKQVSGRTDNHLEFSAIDLNTDPTALPGGPTLPQVLFAQAFTANTGLPATPANIAFIETIAPGTSAAIQAGVANGIQGLQGLQFQPPFLAFPNAVENGLSNDSKTTYQIKAAYKMNDNINLYVSYSTGFKATSWNLSRDSRPFPASQAALTAAGLTQPNQTYGTRFAGPENAKNYEGGIKARFPKGALNVSIFQQSIDGFQSNTFVGTGFVLANAGKQTTKGVEFDATYVPIDPLKITFAGVYLDAKYDSFPGAPGPDGTVQDLTGKKVAGVPEWGFSTSATYTHDFSGETTGFIRADYQYESETSPVERITLASPNPRSKTSNVNGSVGLNFKNGFGLQIWGRNIFNHKGYISAFPGVIQAGTINAYPTQPATYGVLLRKDF